MPDGILLLIGAFVVMIVTLGVIWIAGLEEE